MNDPHDDQHVTAAAAPHEGPIKTPKQLIVAVAASFIVPVVVILLLANYVASASKPAAGSDGLAAEATAKRIQPAGRVVVQDAAKPSMMKTGEQVYQAQCAVCHVAGVAGAPKLGDTAAWAARLALGYEVMLTSALKGKNAMPPQGGGGLSNDEIALGVVYLANQSGGKFDEPQPPAAAASAAAGAASTPN